jgi:hypothetical protein
VGELFDGNNQPVAIYFLDSVSDPAKTLDQNTFFLIPQKPLNVNTTYRAHIKGWDSQGAPFDMTWSFTTVPAAAINYAFAFAVASDGAWIQWETAGPVTSTFLEYGTTTAYGSRAPGQDPGIGPTTFVGRARECPEPQYDLPFQGYGSRRHG